MIIKLFNIISAAILGSVPMVPNIFLPEIVLTQNHSIIVHSVNTELTKQFKGFLFFSGFAICHEVMFKLI